MLVRGICVLFWRGWRLSFFEPLKKRSSSTNVRYIAVTASPVKSLVEVEYH